MTNLIGPMSATPCVSIIVTTFNRAQMLAETLASILAQTYTDFELIIVDNMSEDGTRKYVANLADSRIRYFRNPNNGVIAVNRNYGIRQAKGKYIAFCDDDDLWRLGKLDQQVELLDKCQDVALCYTNAESFIDSTIVKEKMIRRCVRHNHFYQLLRGNFIPNSSVLVRKQVFQQLGLLSTDPMLREDYDMWLRISRHYKLAGIDTSLIQYRVHLSNIAGNRAAETLRAIRTLRHSAKLLGLPWILMQVNVGYQFMKYCFYHIARR